MENGNGALQIATKEPALSFTGWQAMKEQATMLVKSGFLPPAVNTPEKVIAVVMSGKELGIGFMESIRSIQVVQGKPTVSPQLMLALANRTGQLEDQELIATEEKCIFTVKRKGRKAYTNEFGIKEATEMGLIGKDNYKKQKKVMFQWRAIAANLRVTFPDVVLGLYTPEEMGAIVSVDENDEMVVHQAPNQSAALTVEYSKPVESFGDAQEPVEEEKPPLEAILADTSIKPEAPKHLPPRVPFVRKPGCISEAQGKRFFAIAKTNGKNNADIKTYLVGLGIEHSNEIPLQEYDSACKWAEEKMA